MHSLHPLLLLLLAASLPWVSASNGNNRPATSFPVQPRGAQQPAQNVVDDDDDDDDGGPQPALAVHRAVPTGQQGPGRPAAAAPTIIRPPITPITLEGITAAAIKIEQYHLFRDFPPRYDDDRKKAIYAMIPADALKGKNRPPMHVAQYVGIVLPTEFTPGESNIIISADTYNYASVPAHKTHIWVNFADEHLFGFYATTLLAQDELQALEMPGLGAVREMLLALNSDQIKASTMIPLGQKPRTVTVFNVERWINFNTVTNHLYGQAFGQATPQQAVAGSVLINPPTMCNILAMAAPTPGTAGSVYKKPEIIKILTTAYAGFLQAKKEAIRISGDNAKKVVIHTGNWGCGAFGGNIYIMSIVQMVAARAVGVDLHLHAFSTEFADKHTDAKTVFEGELWKKPTAKVPVAATIDKIFAKQYKWGTSNNT